MARSGFHPYKLFKEFMVKCCIYLQTGPSPIRWYLYLEQVILLQVISFSRDSLQRVIMFGDMGKGERDGSNEYNDYQPGSLNTTDQLINDLSNIDIVFHICDLTYSN